MAAPKGNEFWKMRAKSGIGPLYDDPEKLWADCVEYFVYRSKQEMNETQLPFTQDSLCIFLDIDNSTWIRWRNGKDLCHIVTRVDGIIRDQKFSGAAVGSYQQNIIARDLGLSDKRDLKADLSAKIEHTTSPFEQLEKLMAIATPDELDVLTGLFARLEQPEPIEAEPQQIESDI